ncbi:hypothetical protein GCM10007216_19950 [Thalassobacillus devorans]|uniref:Cupin type-2 domain-containing protein n=1 Tax=Thalassobacillus devorans TaxID=279813 RepID=A0ABQ1P1I5_9BACI|nr:cupin domain-containing protein [Thalassobacillus devorans]NIK28061.1 quercetin dioxygenase-like cupin family protein [Thalassobacillus devorans]GGC89179.1 hypothetical protein GCM10007216_19950 [Thalassobacillus devorans]
MEVKKYEQDIKGLQTLFQNEVKFGLVNIQPGERVPGTGLSNHNEDEYSYIIEGSIEGECGGHRFKASEGEATFIPSGEQHWAVNNSDKVCRIVWTLVKP